MSTAGSRTDATSASPKSAPHRRRHAKIVATLGSSSSSREVIRSLFPAGVDVFRLNFSHGTHEQHRDSVIQITGAIGPRETFVSMRPEWGRPDGGATDEEGCYWSCGVSAGRINRFAPNGELIEYVVLPISHPTMPCFGGPDGRDLYVTSLRESLNDEDLAKTPKAGGIFRLRPGIAGAAAALYQG